MPEQLEIPWTSVATILQNQRTALDYHRRYLTVVHLHQQKNYPEEDVMNIEDASVKVFFDPETKQQQHSVFIRRSDEELTRHRIRLLEYLQEL